MAYADYRPLFAEAMDPRFYNIEYLDKRLIDGTADYFESRNAAIIVEIKTFPAGARAVAGLVAAGDMHEIVNDLIPSAEAWGKAQGCQFGMIESRPGWEKAMKSSGYNVFQVSIIKEI